MRRKISFVLKMLTILFSLMGVVLGLVFFKKDGYSHFYKRLLFFTTQSNLWIACAMLLSLIAPYINFFQKQSRQDAVYLIKYIFTVSIALTGIFFCSVLGPFAGDEFRAWSFSSLCTHAFTPALAITDFFVDDYKFKIKKFQIFLTIIPPLAYFAFTMILGACNVDFGRGDTFPYFFLNFKSPAGMFGFVNQKPYPVLGSFYWILLCLIIVLGMGLLFAKCSPTAIRQRKMKKQNS